MNEMGVSHAPDQFLEAAGVRPFLIFALMILLTNSPAIAEGPVAAQVVLKGGLIIDGTGKPGEVGDLAIQGDRIVAVGRFEVQPGATIIDVTGQVVTPGFIDLHTHSDEAIAQAKTRGNVNYLTQGVTTIVTGNCGGGPLDTKAFFHSIEVGGGAGANVIHLIPHGSVRRGRSWAPWTAGPTPANWAGWKRSWPARWRPVRGACPPA